MKYDFYKNRFYALGLSSILLLTGLVVMLVFGLKLDISFRGGSILEYSYTGDIDLNAVQKVADETIKGTVTVQSTESLSSTESAEHRKTIVINVAGDGALSTDMQTNLRLALDKNFSANHIEVGRVTVVDPFIGKETLNNGLLAVLIASVLIVAYVWIRFRTISGPSAGVFALLALLHDVLIAFFSFVVFRFPLNESVIAVVLSILGWSVNDTIVIYDRIRENANFHRDGQTLPVLVDHSIHQSFQRSVNTSMCGFVSVLVAYVFATIYDISSIRQFALPMSIGMVAGTYSSIFLATPFWAMWKTRGGRVGYDD